MYLFLLVICLPLLHHEVQAQKANFCNITESNFVEVNKTETTLVPKKSGGFNLLDMFGGNNKYENVSKTVLGVEKKERVVEDCCKGYKKKDNQCVPIYDTPSSTTTTTTTPAPSSTSTTSAPPEPPPPPTEPVTQATPAPVASETASTQPSPPVPAAEPVPTTQAIIQEPTQSPEVAPATSSEPPVTTAAAAPEPVPSAEPTSAPEPAPAVSSESPPVPEPVALPEPAPSPETPMATFSPSDTPVQTTSASVSPQAESIVSETVSPVQNEPMLSSLIVTTISTPTTGKPVTTPVIVSSISDSSIPSTESAPSNDLTTVKQSDKLIAEPDAIIYSTIPVNASMRRRRSLDKSSDSDSIDTIEILEFQSQTIPDDSKELSGNRDAEFKLNENTVSVKKHHHSLESESDNIVVSDLTADNEDRGYPWIEILEVLSFGAVIFLLVITVQTSFDSETFSMWRASKKIPQEVDSYGEFWVYDSQGNLEEV